MVSPTETTSVLNKMKIASALIVIAAILILFTLPAFDVAPTALRAARAIIFLMMSIASAAFAFYGLKVRPTFSRLFITLPSDGSGPSVLVFTCTLLC